MSINIHHQDGCPHCAKLVEAANGSLPSIIVEQEHSYIVAGDHQFFPGYCMVISKYHVREIHDLPEDVAVAIFRDVIRAGKAIAKSFAPWKLNYASLGNIDEHLHWHVIPRYLNDVDHRDHPWKNAALFSKYTSTVQAVEHLRKSILDHWE